MDRYLPGVVRTVKTLFYRSNKKDKQGLVSRIFRKSSWQEMFAMAAMATGGSSSCRLNFLDLFEKILIPAGCRVQESGYNGKHTPGRSKIAERISKVN
ncbi:uncharacterized protein B0T23DRAFT_383022 [Neurospora hispaniola]|uniref:Uncharacterized protein n=1 Tax=Neurospora hispaniola TaxID=588809 RepID=A0AAJ0I6C4_9PEZI|nr:hypothetical protein B0T23DRAFT_383022 [Neurospora hispaniola]